MSKIGPNDAAVILHEDGRITLNLPPEYLDDGGEDDELAPQHVWLALKAAKYVVYEMGFVDDEELEDYED